MSVVEVCPTCRSTFTYSDSDITKNNMCSQDHHHHHYYYSHCAQSTNCRCDFSCQPLRKESSSTSTSILSTSPISSLSSLSPSSSLASFSSYKQYPCRNSGWRTTLLVFVGILLTLPSAMSRPSRTTETEPESSSSSGHRRHALPRNNDDADGRPAKWINPCRIPATLPTVTDFEIQAQSDSEIFQNIITQVRKAEHQSREFMADFYEESFGSKLEHDRYKNMHYDWLTSVSEKVNKYLGEEIEATKLSELTVEETLRSMYEGLQRFAVGLEQIVLDQAVYGGNFHQHFHEAEFQLKYVLCELQIAMLEKNIEHEDITREIMSEKYRDLDDRSMRYVRDWLIFRDYVNTLEYLRQTFQHFLKKSTRESS